MIEQPVAATGSTNGAALSASAAGAATDGLPGVAGVAGPQETGACFVCPKCRGDLADGGGAVCCVRCGARYAKLDSAYADFAGPDLTFDDWWSQSPEATRHWLEVMAPKDESYEAGVARNYVVPLLRKLGYAPGRVSLLSAACGLAADVDALNDAGYTTWGIDCGNRLLRWPERHHQQRLARGNLFELPFPDASFDLVMAINALEHIGVVGDTTAVADDYEAQRLDAVRSLLRVTKPGGYLLLSGVGRRFPFDLFHTPFQGQSPPPPRPARRRFPLGLPRIQPSRYVRVHWPWEGFSLSYGDYQRFSLATGQADWVRPLPLRGFFAYSNLGRNRFTRPLVPALDWALGSLPAAVYGSWISFFTVVLVHRRAADSLRPATASAAGGTYGTA